MAKVIRTEQLSIDGDKVRLTADSGNLIVNSVDGDSVIPVVSTDEIGSDISSLAVTNTQTNSDISSLAALNTTVNSTLVDFSKYNVYSLKTSTLSTGPGSSSQTITLSNRAFASKPSITAILQTNADDPTMAVLVSNVVETSTAGVYEATFQFSDELPATGESDQATNYRLNILAAVNAADQDLDTIVDSVDSDRDGDGIINRLDYDPDDDSVGSAPGDLVEIYNHTTDSISTQIFIDRDDTDNSEVVSFIQNLSSTQYSSPSAAGLTYSGDNHDFYLLDDILNFEVYQSNQTNYVKDIKVLGYSVWTSTNSNMLGPIMRFITCDDNGNDAPVSGISKGQYLKIKST